MSTGEPHSHNHDHRHDHAHSIAAEADRRILVIARQIGQEADRGVRAPQLHQRPGVHAGGRWLPAAKRVRQQRPAARVERAQQAYSVEFGDRVISEMQMELFSEATPGTDSAEIFRRVGDVDHAESGWVDVADVEQAFAMDGYKEGADNGR